MVLIWGKSSNYHNPIIKAPNGTEGNFGLNNLKGEIILYSPQIHIPFALNPPNDHL
jgi:hypothetical protein